MNWPIFQLFVFIELSLSLAPGEIVIFILSQPDLYHTQLAHNLRADIYNQSLAINKDHLVNIHLLHEAFRHPGYWTFLAVLPEIAASNIIKPDTKWIVLCEDLSYIDLPTLVNKLATEDHKREMYLGHPLHDQEATIIHHFAFFENPKWFPYPMIRSGVGFTAPLIERLAKRVLQEKPATDFFIDASHELSLFIWQNMRTENNKRTPPREGVSGRKATSQWPTDEPGSSTEQSEEEDTNGAKIGKGSPPGDIQSAKLYREKGRKFLMATAPYLCPVKGYGCAIYPNEATSTCSPISAETIFFAIKTCHKFHKERIPTIERTWGRYAIHKRFFSDVGDERIPTVATGVPNTETGHCGKTLSIFKLALVEVEEMNRRLENPVKWIFLSDDDTLLSVSSVCDILGCFNAEEDVYLGERYGYRLHSKDGFNYITGGGGIAFSLPTVKKIVKHCTCPTISSPDDMIVGVCLQRLGIKAIHSSRFHQARPPDYSAKLLAIEQPVSFHKFWQIDPMRVYQKWFRKADETLRTGLRPECDINASPCTRVRSLKNGKTNGDKVVTRNTRPRHIDL